MTDQHLGRRAVVIGAGIGGLAAAGAVAPFFEEVVILERDRLPSDATPRPGVPQGRHLHGLLGGGLKALSTLLPDFAGKLAAAGGVPIRMSADFCAEIGGHARRRHDLGWQGSMQSRPLLELAMQKALAAYPNVSLFSGHRVLAINTTPDGGQVTGIRHAVADSGAETLAADLVIDASGRGAPTLNLLQALDRPRPGRSRSASISATQAPCSPSPRMHRRIGCRGHPCRSRTEPPGRRRQRDRGRALDRDLVRPG